MDLERELPTSSCDIVTAAGELIATTKAAILPDLIMVFDVSIPINVGDEVRRKLPSGLDETFEVVDPRFFEKLQGVKAHYQIKYRRKGSFPHGAGGNYTVHVTGSNSRVNIASTDRSTNVVVEGDVFGNLTAALRKDVRPGPELDRLSRPSKKCAPSKKLPALRQHIRSSFQFRQTTSGSSRHFYPLWPILFRRDPLPHDPHRPQPAEDPPAARARAVDHQRKDDRRLHARGRADGDSCRSAAFAPTAQHGGYDDPNRADRYRNLK
jgi:hypothetical protein